MYINQYSALAEYSSDEVWFNIETGGTYFFFNGPTAQRVCPISMCDSSKFSVFHSLLAFDIVTLEIYDFDCNFQGQRSKKVHFGPKRPPKLKYLNYF
jgi:hypothetical protein